jgi:hypothetical protein
MRRAVPLLALLLSACSADAVDAPEPELETRGAFVAVAADGGHGFELFRTLTVLGDGGEDDVLFFIRYAALPRSFEEARELAQDPELPVASDVTLIGKRYVHSRAWKVVWFRSLTEAEQSTY